MEAHEVDVFIGTDGQVTIEVRGVKGQSCLAITKDVEHALGGHIQNREMRPESMEQSQSTDDHQRLHRG